LVFVADSEVVEVILIVRWQAVQALPMSG